MLKLGGESPPPDIWGWHLGGLLLLEVLCDSLHIFTGRLLLDSLMEDLRLRLWKWLGLLGLVSRRTGSYYQALFVARPGDLFEVDLRVLVLLALSRRRICGGLLILIKGLRGLAIRIYLWAFTARILMISLVRTGRLAFGGRGSLLLEFLALPVGASVVPDLAVFVVDVREGLVDDRSGGLLVLQLRLAEYFQLTFDEIEESLFAPLSRSASLDFGLSSLFPPLNFKYFRQRGISTPSCSSSAFSVFSRGAASCWRASASWGRKTCPSELRSSFEGTPLPARICLSESTCLCGQASPFGLISSSEVNSPLARGFRLVEVAV